MKRLKTIINSMDPKTVSYHEMYQGEIHVIDSSNKMCVEQSPVYYNNGVGFDISVTNKLKKDKPTITIQIPFEIIGSDILSQEFECAQSDYFLRVFMKYIKKLNDDCYNRSRPDEENGKYYLFEPNGEVLKRNGAYFSTCPRKDYINDKGLTVHLVSNEVSSHPNYCLCICLQVQLPKNNLRKTMKMLCHDLPNAVDRFLADLNFKDLSEVTLLAKKQQNIRNWLKNSSYCVFIANGSILPRAKGTDLPMLDAIPFRSTPNDEIEIFGVKGMGIKKGVTVITGGGYSGKSTLLDAISAGIYDHAIGDGRELCITDESAVTISAEDGRSVKHVNISPFIKWLPGGDTSDFSTDHASGSTSQAANIMEAVDCGSNLLLIDEDRSATNFMIRDRMMKELIEKEPITPFTDRVNELHKTHGVSTILVIGGSGEYLSVADKIYMMEDYLIHDVTDKSKNICNSYNVTTALPVSANWQQCRTLYSDRFSSYPEGSGTEKLEVSDMGFVIIGDEKIDVRGLHDIVSPRQLDTLGFMLRYLEVSNNDRKIDIERKINDLYGRIDEEGIDFLYSSFFTTCERFLDLPRKQELMALVNRMRKINMVKGGGVI